MANPLQLLLVGGIAGSLAWGVFEYQRDNKQTMTIPPSEIGPAKVPKIALANTETKPLDSYTETLERPLFFADRKLPKLEKLDPKEKKTAKSSRQTNLPKIRLSAVLIDSEEKSAVVEIRGTGKSRRLEIGQSMSGWELIEVKDQAIIMRSGSKKHQFDLHNFAKPPIQKARLLSKPGLIRPPLNRNPKPQNAKSMAPEQRK